MANEKYEDLRFVVRFFYDLQRLRIQAEGRIKPKGEDNPEQLDTMGRVVLKERGKELQGMEAKVLKTVKAGVEETAIWKNFLADVKGVGPTMAGIILSELDPHKARTVSSFWAYTGVGQERPFEVEYRNGQKGKVQKRTVYAVSPESAPRMIPRKRKDDAPPITVLHVAQAGGFEPQRLRPNQYPSYNTFLKTKMVGVLGPGFLKAGSEYRRYYDEMKHRLESRIEDKCMLCEGSGKYAGKKCGNCEGKGGGVSWGRSAKHRHQAANRYMVKMFLKDLWIAWRESEGLPIRPPYCEEYLGKVHAASSK